MWIIYCIGQWPFQPALKPISESIAIVRSKVWTFRRVFAVCALDYTFAVTLAPSTSQWTQLMCLGGKMLMSQQLKFACRSFQTHLHKRLFVIWILRISCLSTFDIDIAAWHGFSSIWLLAICILFCQTICLLWTNKSSEATQFTNNMNDKRVKKKTQLILKH